MARISPKTTWKLAKAIKGRRKAEVAKSGSATVSKIDGSGTVWIRPLGAASDVPVNGSSIASVKVGDTVTYETGDGRLKVTGNSTDPAVGAGGATVVASAAAEAATKVLSARIGNLEATSITADSAVIKELEADTAKVHDLTADQLSAATGYVGELTAGNVTAQNIIADKAKLAQVDVQQIDADHATIGTLDTTYMHANMSNSDVAWISNGVIANGAISSAMINSVSANKLTAGTIDASNITVTNLNADNITAGTINGQRIGTGSLSLDKLSEDVYTEAEVDDKLSTMQAEIDGAIETWTGTAVPTLNNAPASGWTTNAIKDTHVGDVYFVVNSQSQQNGYNYRFTKSGNTYSWQLIKDNDVTNALQRLTIAEGKITTFDSDISTLKTDTGTLTTKTESLETRMSDAESDILDKVDTTTFNEVSDTVDQHSQTISQHTTAISNKADSSTVTAVTNRVSKNEQDISGINTTIGELQDTVETKADGSTVETVSNRLNTVSNTVDGHTQTLTSVQNTLSTKADSSTVSTLSTKVNNVSDTVDGHTSQLSSITTTQTTIQSTLDKTVKSSIQLWYSKANTTAPSKPTSQVTSTSTSGNAWRIVVPAYNASYPNYYYCWQYEYVDGTYGWSAVVRDIAMGESQATARTADSNASAAVTTANTASTNASTALTTANTANTNASEAKTTATTASTTASEAKTTAETAASDANTAKTNAASAVTTANSASTTATNAQSTANANIKSSVQLWFTKANSTAPSKPTSVVSTSNANTANAWNLVVPVWNKNYPHYFYCYQQQKGDGNYQWTDVVYDRATSEAQQLANTTSTNLTTLQEDYATYKQTTTENVSSIGTRLSTAEGKISTAETNIAQNTEQIALRATKTEVLDTGNMLKDTSASSVAKVYGPANRYWSNPDNTSITPSFVALTDPPEPGITHAAQFVNDGTNTAVKDKGLAFYNSTAVESLPMKEGQTYTVMWWARVTSGSGMTHVFYRSDGTAKNSAKPDGGYYDEPTSEWKQYTRTITMGEVTDYARIWFASRFAASTAGTVQLCGFKLVPAAYATAAELKVQADSIDLKVSKNDVINQINVSTEGATISASKVNIEGAAIFSSGRLSQTSLNNAYDAKGAAATAESNAKANAVKRTQRIWYRKSASGAPSTPGTASSNWVTKADDGNDAWTKMHVAISSTHKYIYTCEQYEMANGTVGYTSVLLDNTITVIDGGNIITGSVTANKLNASDINASKTLTVGAMTDAAAATILNSNVQVGGRNLLKDSVFSTAFGDGFWTKDGLTASISSNTLVIDGSVAATGNKRIYQPIQQFTHEAKTTYTLSCDIISTAACTISFGRRYGTVNTYGVTFDVTTTKRRVSGTYKTTGTTGAFCISAPSNTATVTISNIKLERGNKATDWTPAPEDVDASVEAAAKTATNYISVDSTGIRIADSNPATATTYQHQTATNTEFVVNNESMGEFSGNGVRIGKSDEYHTIVADKRFGIEYDTDRLFDIDADGTTVNIYAGGSTKATGVKYTNAYVEGMLAWFKGGCTISNGGVLDPDGNATIYTAVLQSGSSTQYSILDGDGDEFESAAYGGIYYTTTTPVLSDRWNLDTYLTPMQEVPSAPTSIEMGGTVVRFSDGKTTLVTSGVAEGDSCTARGNQAHAEGQHTRASGRASHAEGYWTSATGSDSHAEGTRCTATGQASHAEGYYCTASGEESHASGLVSEARNARSFAHGTGVISSGVDQVVFGRTNAVDATKALIIGNGTANEDADDDDPYRSNAFTVDWDGRVQGHMLGDPTDGDRYGTASQSSNVSVATGTGKAICSHEFGPGVYVIVGHVQFASNATGYRACTFSTTSGSVPNNGYTSMQARVPAASGVQTHLNIATVLNVTTATTLYLSAMQNSGGALNAVGQMRWVRLL